MSDVLPNKIGRLLAVGIPDTSIDAATRESLLDLRPGCVVLFKRNVDNPEQLCRLTADLHALPGRPIVGIDQEGGRVARLGGPFTILPPAANLGACGDPELAYRVGRLLARELRSIGVDLDFVPVLDVRTHPANLVIGDRAFGTTPQLVTEMALAVHRGLIDGGLLSCGKHFPGHGHTLEDSHFFLPIADRSRQELDAIELPPFKAAIAAGVPMLMTAHVVYPHLDPEDPATLSSTIVRDLLRGEFGFEGVIATDDMDMKAIADHYTVGESAVRALEAGCDMVLVCQALGSAVEARDALLEALRSGRLAESTIDAAIARIDRLALQRPGGEPEACPLPCEEHRDLVAEIMRRT